MNANNGERAYLTPSTSARYPGFADSLPSAVRAADLSEIDDSRAGSTARRVYVRIEEHVVYRPAARETVQAYRLNCVAEKPKHTLKILAMVIAIVWFGIMVRSADQPSDARSHPTSAQVLDSVDSEPKD